MKALALDVASQNLDSAIADRGVIISLVSFIYYPEVIQSAIKSKIHVVTMGYASPAMRGLDVKAQEAGIRVLNEVGVDTGVDYLYAMKVLEKFMKRAESYLPESEPAECAIVLATMLVKELYSYSGGLLS